MSKRTEKFVALEVIEPNIWAYRGMFANIEVRRAEVLRKLKRDTEQEEMVVEFVSLSRFMEMSKEGATILI